MIIDKNSWHFKLYLFSLWRRATPDRIYGNRSTFEEIRREVMKKEKVDLCSYFNRAITLNVFYGLFLAVCVLIIINAFLFAVSNFIFFLTGLLFVVSMFAILFGVFGLVGYVKHLKEMRSSEEVDEEPRPSIFVERFKAFKGKYCPIMEIK